MTLRSRSLLAAGLLLPAVLHANTAPTVVIQSATMRTGTSLMDVFFRVNDPDDATVKVRALAFSGGERSFAKVIKPVTFAEGTGARIGDAIATNTFHTLTWNVAADWPTDLGQVKFEILAMDGRGLLPLDWITIPAAGGQPALTLSKNAPSDPEILDALFWRYADGDSELTLTDGVLKGSAASGIFAGVPLITPPTIHNAGVMFLFKGMNLAPAAPADVTRGIEARANLANASRWHALNQPYHGDSSLLMAWGSNWAGQSTIPADLYRVTVTAIAAGNAHSLALQADGSVVAWGGNDEGEATVPSGLSGVTAVSAGVRHSLALQADGTVVAWGRNWSGQATVPAGLSGVAAIAAGAYHSLALKADGTVVAWGANHYGQTNIPAGLSGVTAIAAGYDHNLALKANGTVVAWGENSAGQTTIPSGLSGITAIAAGGSHSLALKADGTVVAWGINNYGQATVPGSLSGVTAIAAGGSHSLALKADGTVVAWGSNWAGQATVPAGLSGVSAIAAGGDHSIALKIPNP